MCKPGGNQKAFGACGCNCGYYGCGCGCGSFFRRFISRKEEQEMLEGYRDQLKKELEGVEERIRELKIK